FSAFQSVRAPLSISSFPTRLSSVLFRETLTRGNRVPFGRTLHVTHHTIVRFASFDEHFRHFQRLFHRGQAVLLDEGEHFLQALPARKSTRLNSSHQIISYAVFCCIH